MRESSRIRLLVLRALVLSLFLTLGVRLWYLQVLSGDQYRQLAHQNRTRDVVTVAPRGLIVDARGQSIVDNQNSMMITVDRSVVDRLPKARRTQVLAAAAGVLGMSPEDLTNKIRFCDAKTPQPCWNGSPYQPIPVARDVPSATALKILEHQDDFPGVAAGTQSVRHYPFQDLAAHSLGYVAPISGDELKADTKHRYNDNSLIGRGGLEAQYDQYLRGQDGVHTLLVDRFGRVDGTAGDTAPQQGQTVQLNLDAGVQKAAETALKNEIATAQRAYDHGGADPQKWPERPDGGAAVVLDARTGAVVALASEPGYDPEVWAGGISQQDYQHLNQDPNQPLLNRAVQGMYNPGSTYKLVSASTVLADGQATADGIYQCPKELPVGSGPSAQILHNSEGEFANNITLHEALVMSCDTVFDQWAIDQWGADGGLRQGKDLPPAKENFAAMGRGFGFGRKTGIDLPDETSGLLLDRAGKQKQWDEQHDDWCAGAKRRPVGSYLQKLDDDNCKYGFLFQPGEAAQAAIGQNIVASSPLQLAVAYAALANGGTLYAPQLAKAVLGPGGKVVKQFPPRVTGHVPASPGDLAYIRDALYGVTHEGNGTATGAFSGFPLPVAGKTGTAETYSEGDSAWFASYAPADNPKYVVVAVLPHTGFGATFAAPVVRSIYAAMYGLDGQKAVLPADQIPPSLQKPSAQQPAPKSGRAVAGPSSPPQTPVAGGGVQPAAATAASGSEAVTTVRRQAKRTRP